MSEPAPIHRERGVPIPRLAVGRSGTCALRWGIAGLLCAASMAASGFEYQLHGFAAQGFALSQGNDVLGDSRDGSFQFYEAGLNGAIDFGHGWLASGQVLARRAGEVDDGHVRLDYGLLDYRAWEDRGASAGLRLGKVRLPFGLFNDTRDVVFTRPGILLPDSIYSDLSGQQRSVLFSVEGGQLYGTAPVGNHELSLSVTHGRDRKLDDDEKRVVFDLGGLPYEARLRDFWEARLMDEVDGGRWQFAFSYLSTDFGVRADPLVLDAAIDFYLLSARYNAPRYSLIAEYLAQRVRLQISNAGTVVDDDADWSDGGYLQADLRLGRTWTAMARLDAQFRDRGDRDGSDCETGTPPEDRHACYALDTVLGLRWQPDAHWGVWGEHHWIDGYYNKFSLQDNRGRQPESQWSLFLLMLGYRF